MADGPLTGPSADLDGETAKMKATGIASVRVALYWSDAQPTPGALELGPTDALVLAAARQGLTVMPVVLRAPAWARRQADDLASPPRSNADYAAFLKQLVARYGPAGSLWAANPGVRKVPVRTWQLWNEPDIPKYWAPAASKNAWATPYVALARAGRAALKLADPGSTAVCAGLTNQSWIDLRKVYAAHGRGACDVMAIHPFSAKISNVVKLVRLARLEMRKAGDAQRRLLLSEVSWTSAKGYAKLNYGWESTEGGQADRIRLALKALAAIRVSARLTGMYWYTWLSPAPGTSLASFDYAGLRKLDRAGQAVDKPALAAFRETVAALRR